MNAEITLSTLHIDRLRERGFSTHNIYSLIKSGLIESLTADEAYKEGFGVAIDGKPVTGGIKLKFSKTYAQLLLDNREIIFDSKKQRYVKYLSVGGEVDLDCAHIPDGCVAITEGIIDGQAFSLLGGIPTGALPGLSHATKALPPNCGYTIVADHDAWVNFGVMQSLIKGGVHCGSKVAIVPEIEGEPKAGGVEFFKDGKTPSDYRQLLDEASTPSEMYERWLDRQIIDSAATAAKIAVQASKLLGEIYGYAKADTIAEIKELLKSEKFAKWDLGVGDVRRDSHNTQSALKAKERAEDEANAGRAVEICIELIKENPNVELFHSPSPDSIDYASIPSSKNGGVKITHPIASSDFKKFVQGEYFNHSGMGLTSESMNTVIATITAIAAHDSPELPVSKQRIAAHDGRYYLYLADDNQTVIEYSAIGWGVCDNSPVKFIFDKYKAPLPIPQRHQKFDSVWDLTRITNPADRLVVATVMVKALVPGGTDPILAIAGYAGSGKTTTANFLRSLVDPFTKGTTLAKIPEIDHIAIHAQQRRILSIDNISHITSDQSDTLCNVATGGGFSKRTLYTNSEETILDVQNLTILTSIGNVVTKPDLLERSIVIDMLKITDDDRKSESKLLLDFELYHADLLGSLLDITVAALHHRDTTEPPQYSRMVEFAHLGEGVEKCLGTGDTEQPNYPSESMKNRMAAGVEIANDIAIEASPVASTIRDWMKSQQEWTGTTKELLNILKPYAKKSELAGTLPKNANSLGGELKKCESALAQYGIIIKDHRESLTDDPHRTKKKRIYIDEKYILIPPLKKGENPSPSSPTPKDTHSEFSPSNDLKVGEQVGEQTKVVRPVTESSIKNKSLEDIPSNGYMGGRTVGEQVGEQTPEDDSPYSDDM